MKERPILFSGSMVRAILDGRKTQTRRIMRHQPRFIESANIPHWRIDCDHMSVPFDPACESLIRSSLCHHFDGPAASGDRLWVRETWRYHDWTEEGEPWIQYAADDATAGPLTVSDDWTDRVTAAWESLSAPENFAIDAAARDRKWRPSIFMPRAASRITLDVIAVRVERLQDIDEAAIIAEGVTVDRVAGWTGTPWADMPTLHHAWEVLWDSINADRASWASNPWVWVVEFKRAEVRK